jgi:hypothetical protein
MTFDDELRNLVDTWLVKGNTTPEAIIETLRAMADDLAEEVADLRRSYEPPGAA